MSHPDIIPWASLSDMESLWDYFRPESLYWAPRHLVNLWDVKDIYITENGSRPPISRPWTALSMTPTASSTCAIISPAAACHLRGRAGARLFPLEFNGQLGVVRRLRHPLRTDPCKFRDSKTHAEDERIVLPGGQRAKSAGIRRRAPKEAIRLRNTSTCSSCWINRRGLSD